MKKQTNTGRALWRARDLIIRLRDGEAYTDDDIEHVLDSIDCALPLPPLPTPDRVAREFCRVIRQWLTPAQLRAVIKTNRERRDSTCATGDYCDSNMAMSEAFARVWGQPESRIDVGNQHSVAVWNRAWDMAKAADFNQQKVKTVSTKKRMR